jgi:hypothetical protein
MVSASVQSDKAMATASKSSGIDGKEELFRLNQVSYKMPPSLSLVSKRTVTKGYFTQTAYPKCASTVSQAVMNTGEFYVNPKTSYLVIQAGIDINDTSFTKRNTDVHALLGQGNILSLIDEVYFTSASGTEICRENDKGLQTAVISRAMTSQEFLNTNGELSGWAGGTLRECFDLKGWNSSADVKAGNYNYPIPYPIRNTSATYLHPTTTADAKNTTYGTTIGSVDIAYDAKTKQAPVFIVPMDKLLSCFNPYMSCLWPAAALAGGVLSIRWKNFQEALIANGNGLATAADARAFLSAVDVKQIYILWDSYQLNDSVLKRLNEVSAGVEGLSVMFDCWDWATTSTSSTAVEAQVAQAKSRILRSVCIVRDSGLKADPFANKLCSEPAIDRETGLQQGYSLNGAQQPLVNTYQAQLGSLYFPQQPLTLPEEYVMNAYYILCKGTTDETDSSSLSKDDFYGAYGKKDPAGPSGGGDYKGDPTIYTSGSQPPWTQNWGGAIYGFLAERSQLLQLTGLPISNARLLRHKFNFNYTTKSGKDRTIDVFTHYTRVMKVFLGGRVVMRE